MADIQITPSALADIAAQLPPGALGPPSTYDGATLHCTDALAAQIGNLDRSGVVAARLRQVATLRAACDAAIAGGISSSALGAPHTYPTDQLSQSNLIASVVASQLSPPSGWTTPFWCVDASGTWAFVQHTPAQIQQVGQDVKAAIVAAQQKLATLTAQVAAMAAPAAIAQVLWQ